MQDGDAWFAPRTLGSDLSRYRSICRLCKGKAECNDSGGCNDSQPTSASCDASLLALLKQQGVASPRSPTLTFFRSGAVAQALGSLRPLAAADSDTASWPPHMLHLETWLQAGCKHDLCVSAANGALHGGATPPSKHQLLRPVPANPLDRLPARALARFLRPASNEQRRCPSYVLSREDLERLDIRVDSMPELEQWLSSKINLDRRTSSSSLSDRRLRALSDHIRYWLSFQYVVGGVRAGDRLPLIALCDGCALADLVAFIIKRQQAELSGADIGLSTGYARGVVTSFLRVVEFSACVARAEGNNELESKLVSQQQRLESFESQLAKLHSRVPESGEALAQQGRYASDDQVEELKTRLFARALRIEQDSITAEAALEYLNAIMIHFSYGEFPNVRAASLVNVLAPVGGELFNATRARCRENRLFRCGDGDFRLVVHKHKNAHRPSGSVAARPIHIRIPKATNAARLVDFYLSRVRPVLLARRASEFLFVVNGEGFTESAWVRRIASITRHGLGVSGIGVRFFRHLHATTSSRLGLPPETQCARVLPQPTSAVRTDTLFACSQGTRCSSEWTQPRHFHVLQFHVDGYGPSVRRLERGIE